MALPKALRYAVLHVGSSSMSITILEYKGIDDVRVIDYAAREVTFGDYCSNAICIVVPYVLWSHLIEINDLLYHFQGLLRNIYIV